MHGELTVRLMLPKGSLLLPILCWGSKRMWWKEIPKVTCLLVYALGKGRDWVLFRSQDSPSGAAGVGGLVFPFPWARAVWLTSMPCSRSQLHCVLRSLDNQTPICDLIPRPGPDLVEDKINIKYKYRKCKNPASALKLPVLKLWFIDNNFIVQQ